MKNFSALGLDFHTEGGDILDRFLGELQIFQFFDQFYLVFYFLQLFVLKLYHLMFSSQLVLVYHTYTVQKNLQALNSLVVVVEEHILLI